MSALSLQPQIVKAYEQAQRELKTFHAAVDHDNPETAAIALHRAAQALCGGLTAAVADGTFWAETADILRNPRLTSQALQSVLADLEKTAEEEANILRTGGYSSESVASLLGTFETTLAAFREFPSGNTLELVRERVSRAQQIICTVANKPVVIIKKNESFWGRAYRLVKNSLKVLGGVGVIVGDVTGLTSATAATAGALTPLVIGVAFASVAGGFETILDVGEAIDGNIHRQ